MSQRLRGLEKGGSGPGGAWDDRNGEAGDGKNAFAVAKNANPTASLRRISILIAFRTSSQVSSRNAYLIAAPTATRIACLIVTQIACRGVRGGIVACRVALRLSFHLGEVGEGVDGGSGGCPERHR